MVSTGQPVISDAHCGSRVQMPSSCAARRCSARDNPVGLSVAEQAVHDGAGERAVGARPHQHREVGLLHGAVHVDVDRHDPGAALLAGAHCAGHHVDLGVDRVGAQITTRSDFVISRGSGLAICRCCGIAAPGRIVADGLKKPEYLWRRAGDAVAHDQAHGAGIEVGPDRLRPRALLDAEKFLGDQIERIVPRDRREVARPFRSFAHQRPGQPVRMVDALGIARDLGADHPRGVAVVLGAAHAVDGVLVEHPTSSAQVEGNRADRRRR